jgi:hypothetical protein
MSDLLRGALCWSICLACLCTSSLTLAADGAGRQRLVVLTDVEADPDDTQSLVRLMLYSNDIDLEGIIATTSTHMRDSVHPESIRDVIRAYGQVQPNLLKHDRSYPDEAALQSLVTTGLPMYGMAGVGKGHDSPGSEWIIRALEKADDRPLWIAVWGGANTLAQALDKLRATRSTAELNRLIDKLRVYTISDQDDSGAWLRRTFPQLFYIVSPGGYGKGTWGAMMQVVEGIDNRTISNAWLAANIQQNHGPLGAVYPDVAYGMEGDTPSFLALIPNGLSVPEHPEWGGWGGRYERYVPKHEDLDPTGFTGGVPVEAETRPIWTNAEDELAPWIANDYGRAVEHSKTTFRNFRVTLWRWRDDFQNDFAARMDWTTQPYDKANHPPLAALAHADRLTVKSGERFVLDAAGTRDPDGDSLSYLWFQYPEAGTLKAPMRITGAGNLRHVGIVAPDVTSPQTAHMILRVTDKGTPALSRYRRVIVTVVPRT